MSGGRDQSPVEVDKLPDVLDELKDKTAEELLIAILLELQKVTIHLEIVTETQISEEDT